MTGVARLVTYVDLSAHDPGPDSDEMSVDARHVALLDDGREVLLLGDRGWSGRISSGRTWDHESARGMRDTARTVVGADEPYGERTEAEMWAGHWQHLAGVLRAAGIAIEPDALSRLPHDVELSDRIIARLPRQPEIRRVYLMTDHMASSLWHGDRHFGVHPESLGLSARTCRDLWAWSDMELRSFDAWMAGEPRPFTSAEFMAEGLRLWRVTRAELAGRCEVGFAFFDDVPQDEDRPSKRIEWDPDAPSAQWDPDDQD